MNHNGFLRVIIDEEPCSYAHNMAIDEAMMRALDETKLPTLRFYKWKNPSLSIGNFQKISEIDLEFLEEMGIDLVRRPTGGRAVLHDDELTYSVVIPLEYFEEKSVIGSYKKIATALVFGLKKIGIECDMQRKKRSSDEKLKGACFLTPSMYEITVDGKKLIGSAQVRSKKVILQHGSIPFSLNVDVYSNCFKLSEKAKKRLRNMLKVSTATIRQLAPEMDERTLVNNLIRGFEEVFKLEHFIGGYSKDELDLFENLKEKYESEEWTFKI